MPALGKRITQPADVVDTYSQKGDLVVTHSPEIGEYYRAEAMKAQIRQQVQQSGGPVAAVQDDPGLPSIGVARAVAGRRLNEMRASAARIERDLSAGPFGASGQVVPALVTRNREYQAELARLREEIVTLENQDDVEVCEWAARMGWH